MQNHLLLRWQHLHMISTWQCLPICMCAVSLFLLYLSDIDHLRGHWISSVHSFTVCCYCYN